MKNLFLLLSIGFITLAFNSCNDKAEKKDDAAKDDLRNEIVAKIGSLEEEIMKQFDDAKVKELVDLCVDFEKKFPQDSMVPYFLYKAGSNYSYLNQPYEALKCYDRVYKLYPDYEKAPVCLFHLAGIYSDQLNDTAKARVLYNVFLEKYPNHKLSGDAKLSLENLGKSLEDLIEQWEENETSDSTQVNV